MDAPDRWWESFFDDVYAEVCLGRIDPATTAATVDFLVRELSLEADSRVLDQCCGTGRLSLPLASRGLSVVGVDVRPSYVERAARDAHREGVDARFVCGDAREHRSEAPFEAPFDAVVNWFTSFGYADEADDRALFARAFEALRPGGRIAVDYFNVVPVLAGLLETGPAAAVKRSLHGLLGALSSRVGRYPHEELASGISTVGVRADFEAGVLRTRWDVGGRRRESRLRIYLPHHIAGLLSDAGFEACELRGSVDGRAFEASSERCIVLARRPGA